VARAPALAGQMSVLAAVAGDAQLRQFADNPKVGAVQVFDVIAGVAARALRWTPRSATCCAR
jgi:F-type H+-transporting ATPase subunit delta